ncbi:hypothetical protein ACT17_22895 [Mycolicibacterium conceptionense]|uniref:FtsK domain-containing protein n=1 Tax=Mycolicibacterium conceptionense TaxID=451644 RepID=A0A0J8WSG2_9MYCO|nr:FtsK/SpoIIIE domain-containing protein [Mycolicibacterium conceptionense]KMV15944.1 hypothetical protein ACT17_22895 [Mycolicibacterium conceptionense]
MDRDDTQYRLAIELDTQPDPEPELYPSKSEAVAAIDTLCAERGWIASAVYDERRGSIRSGDDDYVGSWSIELDVPDFLTVLGIDDITTHDFRAAWERSAADETIRIPVGYLRDGDELLPTIDYLSIDYGTHADGRNVAVTGRTGSGKSYLLREMALALAAKYGPEQLALVFVDGYGGATFRGLDQLPHTAAWCAMGAYDPHEVYRVLSWLHSEVSRRDAHISHHQCIDHAEYRRLVARGPVTSSPLPRIVVFLDELFEPAERYPGIAAMIVSLMIRGPRYGVHVVWGSQHLTSSAAGGVIDHCEARYSLTVNSPEHSWDMLGVDDAATMIPGPLHGKALRRFGDGDVTQLVALPSQARVGGPLMSVTADAALLDRITALADTRVLPHPSQSLSRPITLADIPHYPRLDLVEGGAKFLLGLLDVPEDGTQLPWVVDLENKWNLAISGSGGILPTLMATSAVSGPDAPAFVILDFGGGTLAGVADAPNVAHYLRGTVDSDHADVRSSLHRRSQASLAAVKSLVERRENGQGSDPYNRVIVAIAGIGEFLSGATETEREDLLATCHRGPAVGVHVAAIGTTERFFELDDLIRARRVESVEARYGYGRELRVDPATGEPDVDGRRARIVHATRRVIEPDRSDRGVPVYGEVRVSVREVTDEIGRYCTERVPALTDVVVGGTL